ncbi:MAG: riboflavin synthase [Gammaproteobacteria bacterium]|nr:riboflavin synthase [Gammaproteobacteria bacterium]MCP4088913.1 riboflavin synthase [Gammaproteobacteria bacterium]MCP4274929.1 riboflavin synthase [Gammaproteobacteria bacterium]MCP4832004.1 riboflavin synthase [Gammaproteobacteria bacterium]MCP4929439.1 riboflavin synthase [Gammaproteobacteria bacterium]
MFTGIVSAKGTVSSIDRQEGQARFTFASKELDMRGVKLGDSIAVNGVCLTVVDFSTKSFSADLSRETLGMTTFANCQVEARVNLERALALGDSLGGHMVTGHIDGVGTVRSVLPDAGSVCLKIEVPELLARYIAKKGSVCVDGVSLTVNSVFGAVFELMIVPHTQVATIIDGYEPGTPVNIEVDMIARYLERLMQYTSQ